MTREKGIIKMIAGALIFMLLGMPVTTVKGEEQSVGEEAQTELCL